MFDFVKYVRCLVKKESEREESFTMVIEFLVRIKERKKVWK